MYKNILSIDKKKFSYDGLFRFFMKKSDDYLSNFLYKENRHWAAPYISDHLYNVESHNLHQVFAHHNP